MTTPDVIVAGAGIWGCTVARTLAEAGLRVQVLEERPAVGGNVRCEDAPNGIEVHLYGSHIFHTGNADVWRFVNRFAQFNGYQHKVLARHAGETYFLPLGLALVNRFYGKRLTPAELPAFIRSEAGDIGTPRNFEEQAIAFIGRPLYEAFIKGYTAKQWGTDPRNLDASIIRRLPVRASYDVNYFTDWRQGIPLDGYNALFARMLDHVNIDVRVNERFSLSATSEGMPVFYSGPLDALFDYRFGPLPWRSLRFEFETVSVADAQGTSVVNFVDADVPYTRQHEFKHYHPERLETMNRPETVICREYPVRWSPGDEPYYPVNDSESEALLLRYREAAGRIPNLIVGGRLGLYRYLDMDRSVENALQTARAWLAAR